MSIKSLELELGALHPPSKVAHLFGVSADEVRRMCAEGDIDCVAKVGRDGRNRYWISENAIRAWRRKHRKPAA